MPTESGERRVPRPNTPPAAPQPRPRPTSPARQRYENMKDGQGSGGGRPTPAPQGPQRPRSAPYTGPMPRNQPSAGRDRYQNAKDAQATAYEGRNRAPIASEEAISRATQEIYQADADRLGNQAERYRYDPQAVRRLGQRTAQQEAARSQIIGNLRQAQQQRARMGVKDYMGARSEYADLNQQYQQARADTRRAILANARQQQGDLKSFRGEIPERWRGGSQSLYAPGGGGMSSYANTPPYRPGLGEQLGQQVSAVGDMSMALMQGVASGAERVYNWQQAQVNRGRDLNGDGRDAWGNPVQTRPDYPFLTEQAPLWAGLASPLTMDTSALTNGIERLTGVDPARSFLNAFPPSLKNQQVAAQQASEMAELRASPQDIQQAYQQGGAAGVAAKYPYRSAAGQNANPMLTIPSALGMFEGMPGAIGQAGRVGNVIDEVAAAPIAGAFRSIDPMMQAAQQLPGQIMGDLRMLGQQANRFGQSLGQSQLAFANSMGMAPPVPRSDPRRAIRMTGQELAAFNDMRNDPVRYGAYQREQGINPRNPVPPPEAVAADAPPPPSPHSMLQPHEQPQQGYAYQPDRPPVTNRPRPKGFQSPDVVGAVDARESFRPAPRQVPPGVGAIDPTPRRVRPQMTQPLPGGNEPRFSTPVSPDPRRQLPQPAGVLPENDPAFTRMTPDQEDAATLEGYAGRSVSDNVRDLMKQDLQTVQQAKNLPMSEAMDTEASDQFITVLDYLTQMRAEDNITGARPRDPNQRNVRYIEPLRQQLAGEGYRIDRSLPQQRNMTGSSAASPEWTPIRASSPAAKALDPYVRLYNRMLDEIGVVDNREMSGPLWSPFVRYVQREIDDLLTVPGATGQSLKARTEAAKLMDGLEGWMKQFGRMEDPGDYISRSMSDMRTPEGTLRYPPVPRDGTDPRTVGEIGSAESRQRNTLWQIEQDATERGGGQPRDRGLADAISQADWFDSRRANLEAFQSRMQASDMDAARVAAESLQQSEDMDAGNWQALIDESDTRQQTDLAQGGYETARGMRDRYTDTQQQAVRALADDGPSFAAILRATPADILDADPGDGSVLRVFTKAEALLKYRGLAPETPGFNPATRSLLTMTREYQKREGVLRYYDGIMDRAERYGTRPLTPKQVKTREAFKKSMPMLLQRLTGMWKSLDPGDKAVLIADMKNNLSKATPPGLWDETLNRDVSEGRLMDAIDQRYTNDTQISGTTGEKLPDTRALTPDKYSQNQAGKTPLTPENRPSVADGPDPRERPLSDDELRVTSPYTVKLTRKNAHQVPAWAKPMVDAFKKDTWRGSQTIADQKARLDEWRANGRKGNPPLGKGTISNRYMQVMIDRGYSLAEMKGMRDALDDMKQQYRALYPRLKQITRKADGAMTFSTSWGGAAALDQLGQLTDDQLRGVVRDAVAAKNVPMLVKELYNRTLDTKRFSRRYGVNVSQDARVLERIGQFLASGSFDLPDGVDHVFQLLPDQTLSQLRSHLSARGSINKKLTSNMSVRPGQRERFRDQRFANYEATAIIDRIDAPAKGVQRAPGADVRGRDAARGESWPPNIQDIDAALPSRASLALLEKKQGRPANRTPLQQSSDLRKTMQNKYREWNAKLTPEEQEAITTRGKQLVRKTIAEMRERSVGARQLAEKITGVDPFSPMGDPDTFGITPQQRGRGRRTSTAGQPTSTAARLTSPSDPYVGARPLRSDAETMYQQDQTGNFFAAKTPVQDDVYRKLVAAGYEAAEAARVVSADGMTDQRLGSLLDKLDDQSAINADLSAWGMPTLETERGASPNEFRRQSARRDQLNIARGLRSDAERAVANLGLPNYQAQAIVQQIRNVGFMNETGARAIQAFASTVRAGGYDAEVAIRQTLGDLGYTNKRINQTIREAKRVIQEGGLLDRYTVGELARGKALSGTARAGIGISGVGSIIALMGMAVALRGQGVTLQNLAYQEKEFGGQNLQINRTQAVNLANERIKVAKDIYGDEALTVLSPADVTRLVDGAKDTYGYADAQKVQAAIDAAIEAKLGPRPLKPRNTFGAQQERDQQFQLEQSQRITTDKQATEDRKTIEQVIDSFDGQYDEFAGLIDENETVKKFKAGGRPAAEAFVQEQVRRYTPSATFLSEFGKGKDTLKTYEDEAAASLKDYQVTDAYKAWQAGRVQAQQQANAEYQRMWLETVAPGDPALQRRVALANQWDWTNILENTPDWDYDAVKDFYADDPAFQAPSSPAPRSGSGQGTMGLGAPRPRTPPPSAPAPAPAQAAATGSSGPGAPPTKYKPAPVSGASYRTGPGITNDNGLYVGDTRSNPFTGAGEVWNGSKWILRAQPDWLTGRAAGRSQGNGSAGAAATPRRAFVERAGGVDPGAQRGDTRVNPFDGTYEVYDGGQWIKAAEPEWKRNDGSGNSAGRANGRPVSGPRLPVVRGDALGSAQRRAGSGSVPGSAVANWYDNYWSPPKEGRSAWRSDPRTGEFLAYYDFDGNGTPEWGRPANVPNDAPAGGSGGTYGRSTGSFPTRSAPSYSGGSFTGTGSASDLTASDRTLLKQVLYGSVQWTDPRVQALLRRAGMTPDQVVRMMVMREPSSLEFPRSMAASTYS